MRERRSGKERRTKPSKPAADRRNGKERRMMALGDCAPPLHRRVLMLAVEEERKVKRLAKAEGRSINSLLRELILLGLVASNRGQLRRTESREVLV